MGEKMRSFVAMCVLSCAVAAAFPDALQGPEEVDAKAPDVFHAEFTTGSPDGSFVVEVHRSWAPKGADRFYSLVRSGFYDNCRVFRAVKGFVAQFGINGNPSVQSKWRGASADIKDDPVIQRNARGTIVFATSGPNTRTTQVFININDNSFLDSQGFAPFGRVIGTGMDAVDAFYKGYGEKPDQGEIQTQGNSYLQANFPQLSYFKAATIVKGAPASDVVPEEFSEEDLDRLKELEG